MNIIYKFLNHKYRVNFFFLISFFVFIILAIIKTYNFKSSFYDLIFYLNYYKEIGNGNFSLLFNFNFQLINFFIAYFLKLFPIEKWYLILIIIQSFCLSIPHLIFKKNINLHLIYFLFPTIWFSALNNFHPDVFVVPIIFLLNKEIFDKKSSDFKVYFYLILIVSIKFTFIFLVAGYVIVLFYNNRNRKILTLSITFLFLYIFLYLLFDDHYKYFNLENFSIQYKDYLFENFFNKRYLLSIIVIILASGYFIKPSFIKILPALFLLILYYFLPFDHIKNYYTHYYLSIVPFFIFAIEDSIQIKKFNKKLSTFIIFIHIIFSPSIISVIFWNDLNWFYDKKTIFGFFNNLNTHKFINDLELNSKTIYLENNAIPIELFNSTNKLEILNLNFKDADYIFLRSKKPFFIDDYGCYISIKECNADFISNYKKIIKKININFDLIFDDEKNIKIYKKK